MSKVDQKTLIPIGVALVVIGGGAGWMTKMDMTVAAHATQILNTKQMSKEKFEKLQEILLDINLRLAGIEGELKRIKK